jgi:hypothetical protein
VPIYPSVAVETPAPAKLPAAAQPPADPNADMAAWMALANPGEAHARLETLVGTWKVHGKFSDPTGKVTESDSTAVFSMILGDRFLQQEVHGSFEGMEFVGRGVIGYDNAKKKFSGSWIDNMGTGIMTSEGDETVRGKVWAFSGTFVGPGGPVRMRDVLTKVSDDELRWESSMDGAAIMSLHYVRQK